MNKLKKKKVLVTGASGFLGSHLADALEENGYQVVLFDSTPSKYKTKTQKEFIGDILDPDAIAIAIKGCDAVYHFAAQADIQRSSDNPVETIRSNVIGTQNILEACKQQKIGRIIFASTIYVYSELGSFYRVSKQACEKIIEQYQKEYGINYTILRFGSLYGPRANKFNSIVDMLDQALKNKKIIWKGNGEELREYIHIKDAAQLSIDALHEKYENKHLIITGSQQIKIKELLTMIKEIFGGEINILYGNQKKSHHYHITPFIYRPQIAKKLTPATYYDLGQGIMEIIYKIEHKFEK